MTEKKTNKKMSSGKTRRQKKLTARISNLLYLKAKFIADAQGSTMEQKIAELLKKDIQYVSTQKWFIDYLLEEEIQDFSSLGFNPLAMVTPTSTGKKSGSVSFEDNDINNKGDDNE